MSGRLRHDLRNCGRPGLLSGNRVVGLDTASLSAGADRVECFRDGVATVAIFWLMDEAGDNSRSKRRPRPH